MRAACTTTSASSGTARSRAGRYPRDRVSTPARYGSPCRSKTIRWPMAASKARSPPASTAPARSCSGTGGPGSLATIRRAVLHAASCTSNCAARSWAAAGCCSAPAATAGTGCCASSTMRRREPATRTRSCSGAPRACRKPRRAARPAQRGGQPRARRPRRRRRPPGTQRRPTATSSLASRSRIRNGWSTHSRARPSSTSCATTTPLRHICSTRSHGGPSA